MRGLLLTLGGLMLAPAAGAQDGPAAAPAVPVRVALVSPAGAPLIGEGHVVFLGIGAEPPLVYPVKLPAAAAARLPAGSQWTVRADFPGYFAATSLLRVPEEVSAPVELSMVLRPAGLLAGTFSLKEAGDKPPERLEVRFEPVREGAPKTGEVPAGSAVCATSPERKWRCNVPAGRFDIALHARGFVPHYLRQVAVAAAETKSLGNLVLSRGASVAGWVALEDGTPPKACAVRLEPAEAPGPGSDPALRLLRTAVEAPCRQGGFFQLAGVAAGSYALVAESGRARAVLSPLEVWNGAESRLANPLVLKLPVEFALELAPATDWMGRPWRVEVLRASDYRAGWEEPPIEATTRADGRVPLPAQSPGRFLVTVYDWAGNAVFSDPYVELSDPGQPYFIPLGLLWLEGKIRLGDEPLQARLFFGGRSGATSIRMESDADGRFEGPLPRDGRWQVDVHSQEPSLKTTVLAQVKSDRDRASVTIELPGTRVHGRVVDPAGNPAARAFVSLTSIAGHIGTESNEKGEFEFRAFPEGTTDLSAERGTAGGGGREQSETQTFEASEDAAHGPVVLALQRNVAVRGRALTASGPVVGAMVHAWPTSGGSGSVSAVRTRPDGSFELKLPERTSALYVVVSPPGGKLKAYEVRLAGAEEVVLPVGTEGGDLLVDFGKRGPEVFNVWQDEIGIPFGVLAHWTQGNEVPFKEGPRLRLPQLAAGFYTVCSGPPAVVEDVAIWKERARCSSGYLAAGSALELRLP